MLKTLVISFRMKNAYRVNSILCGFRQIPLIGRLIPESVYSITGFKIFAYVISILFDIIGVFLGKLIYFFFAVVYISSMFRDVITEEDKPEFFLHILIPLTIIGAFINNFMFRPEKHKYYAVIQLGMNARKFMLTDYCFNLAKYFIGFTLFTFIFGLGMNLKPWECLLFSLFAVSAKTAACPIHIWKFIRSGKTVQSSGSAGWLLILALAVVALYVIGICGIMIPHTVSWIIMAAVIVGSIVSLPFIFRYGEYRAVSKSFLTAEFMSQLDGRAQRQIIRNNNQKKISVNADIFSTKSGFEYLNDLFVKRHKKLLWGASVKITIVLAVILTALCGYCVLDSTAHAQLNSVIKKSLPYFVFIMYALNRGLSFTQALFVNCDHSLLTYSFFKQPKPILTLFRIRLREIIKVNLLPAATGGLGLTVLLYITGGTDDIITYPVIFLSMCALSVFFSVHYLTIYYLLQPYTAGTEVKNGAYRIITIATYMVCYCMIYLRSPALIFGALTIAFCVAYCILACILVYKFAPRTFRIHN